MTEYENLVIRGKYMPHIDGIRALSVIAVILYHIHPYLCPGGFSGVDVFFVISGYLIGGGILRDLQQGTFSFTQFYVRRIKRIMPAYFVMICGVLLAGLLLYHYEPLASLGYAAFRSAYFFTNFYFYKYVGDYFTGNADTHALTNLWSLSTEEQFYIVIPFLMWLIWKMRSRALLYVLGALALFSFIQAETALQSPVIRAHLKAFYMLLPRMWELLCGVLLAGIPGIQPSRGTRMWGSWAACAGLLLVLGGYVFLYRGCHFPGSGALAAVAGGALLIRYGAQGIVGMGLTSNLAVGIGRISYSLYLWHWPIIVYAHYIWGDTLTYAQMAGVVALSFGLAYVSWRWVEMPIRRAKSISASKAIAGLGIACALVGSAGYLLQKTHGLVYYIHPSANQYASLDYPGKFDTMPAGHFGLPQLSQLPDEKGKMQNNTIVYVGDRSKAPEFVLIGDSHAEAMRSGLDVVCKEKGVAGVSLRAKTCPISGVEIINSFSNATESFLQWLSSAPGIDRVIILCRWSMRLSGSGQILYRTGEPIPPDSSHNTELLEEGLRRTCERIKDMGKEVILLGPIPTLRISPGSALRRLIMLGEPMEKLNDAVSLEEYLKTEEEVFRILTAIQRDKLARVVWVHPVLEQNGRFRGLMQNELFYHDSNHLSKDGSIFVARHIFPELFPPAEAQDTCAEQTCPLAPPQIKHAD